MIVQGCAFQNEADMQENRFSAQILFRSLLLWLMATCNAALFFVPILIHDFLPLNKIASSCETARVVLVLKTILVEVYHVPMLVFNEMDS